MAKKRKNKSKAYQDMFKLKDNYVFYQRLNDDGAAQAHIWKKVYTSAMNEFSDGLKFYNVIDTETIGNTLIAQGYNEQEKEIEFLYQMFGIPKNRITLSNYPQYINQINEIIGLKDDYKNLLNLIKQGRRGQNKKAKERAYTGTAYFDSYLTTALRRNIDNFIRTKEAEEIVLSDSKILWENKLKEITEISIKEAIERMANQKDKINNEEYQIWSSVLSLLQLTESQYDQLKSDIFKRYNLDKVIDELFKWDSDRRAKNKGSTKGLSNKIKNSYDLTERSFRSINGLIEEYVNTLSGDYNLSSSKTVLKNNIAKTDSVTIFSMAGRLNLDSLGEILNENLGNSSSLIDAEEIIDNFYNSYMKRLTDTFIIFESTKAYSLGENFRGFHGGSARPLSNLPSFLEAIGSNIDGETLISLLYNTIPGAIGDSNSAQIKENVSYELSKYMANFLFDDWKLVGQSTNNAIHIFTLDSIKIPLSYLLIATGQAFLEASRNPSSFFKVSFSLPSSILYPTTIRPFDKDKGMEGYWNEQRNSAINESTFSIKFLRNFKSLIEDLIKKL